MSTRASDIKRGAAGASPATATAAAPAHQAEASAAAPQIVNPAAPVKPVGPKPQLVKKISTKTVWGKVEKDPTEPYTLFRVAGKAHGVRTGSTSIGEYTAFVGMFEATNAKTGARFRAGTCFLPGIVTDLIVAGMRAAQEQDIGASVEFVLDIGIAPDSGGAMPNAYGYKYTVSQVVELAQSDPLAGLLAQAPAPLAIEHKG